MKFKRVILVDDNETALFLNNDIVEEYFGDIEIISFSNSQEFIDSVLSKSSWRNEPTLVLLDINMPGKFGFDVLDDLEEEFDELEELKFIMVTSSTLKRDLECSDRYESMIGYIVKPLSVENLGEIVH